ncbi:integral membrane protein GPR137B-like [Brachionus plicatilis]|uniref:Integral membrane protein GPR137B-like n=1 Tax=Brachionus plicatilis TaxID=10195 RepID=A0A3M7SQU6_BRAPC|nr:integral membrane protein GPR137B-like [Brachionus plicatilis]
MDEFITFPFPTAAPSIPASVYLPLTIILIIFYSSIFIIAYYQLFLIWYYKHKRFSYQTAFLFSSLVWSSLRITLFSFYFENATDANKLTFSLYFAFYCLPVVIQFSILCLLVLYYGQVYFKIATRINQDRNKLRLIILVCILIFFVTSLVSAYMVREICIFKKTAYHDIYRITLIRILITDTLFVIIGFLLSSFLYRIAHLSINYNIPEQNNISVLKSIIVSVCTSFLLISRTFYNILAISIDGLKLPGFDFDWINVSDQADLVNLTETKKYITFVVVILIWELIPSLVVVVLFRVKQDHVSNEAILNINSYLPNEKSVFIESNSYNVDNYETDSENSVDENFSRERRSFYNSISDY